MAVSNVATTGGTDASGNSFTTSVSNDKLSNNDFLQLMITELKLQDPTKPMDSQKMLQTQLQMSTIETNQQTMKAMEQMAQSFTNTSIANVANMIGKNIEDNNTSDNGVAKAYKVLSVETIDGELQVKARQILYMEDVVKTTDDKVVSYNGAGEILDENGDKTGKKFVLKNPGELALKDGKPVVLDENNEEIAEHEYKFTNITSPVYSSEISTVPFKNITKIF